MKNLTRVLALVLTFAMMISSVAMAASFTDIAAGSTYAEATAVLADLGILYGYEDGTFGADKVITRAEVAAVVNRLQGLSDAAKAAGGATQYTDVPSTEWYAGDVNLATQMGIVNGDGNGLFRPNDQVKYEEAVKMIVAALGYDQQYVLNKGGWPTGYLVIATESGVSKGLSAGAGEPAYRGTVAKLAYNALTAKTFAFLNYATGDGSAYYGVSEKDIVLEQKLETYKYTGYVSANSITSLTSTKGVEDGKVTFVTTGDQVGNGVANWTKSSETVLVGATDVAATLGNTIDLYVVENEDGDFEAVSYVVNAKNDLVAIENPADIQDTTTGSYKSVLAGADGDKLVVYDEDADEDTEYELDKNATLIVNGQYYGTMAAAKADNMYNLAKAADADLGLIYAPAYGAVELLDNDNDGAYEFVFVTSYETAVVSNVIATSSAQKIYNNGATIDLTKHVEGEEGYAYSITLDGEEAEIADLQKDDVISVAMTYDQKVYDIKATRATVAGTVSETDKSDASKAKWEFVVDGETYTVANLADKSKAELVDDVEAGNVVTFYLDVFGNVAKADRTSTSAKNYGFIVSASKDSVAGDELYEVRLLDKNGEMAVYPLAEKVNYAAVGAKGKTTSTVAGTVYDNAIKPLSGGDTWINTTAEASIATSDVVNYANRVVTYKLNSAGEISELVFATNDSSESYITYNGSASLQAEYNARTSMIAGKEVSEDTVIFNLPINTGVTRDDFSVTTVAALSDDAKYDVAFLSVDDEGVAGAMVIVNNPAKVASGSNLAIVTKAVKSTNAEGDDIYKITFYQNGEQQTLATTYDVASAMGAIAVGQVFEYSVDAEGAIDALALGTYDLTTPVAYTALAGYASELDKVSYDADSAKDQYVYGVVYKVKNNRLTIGYAANRFAHVVAEDANVYVIDVTGSKAKINVSDIAEIQAADDAPVYDEDYDYTVFMKYYGGEIVDVIAIKGLGLWK